MMVVVLVLLGLAMGVALGYWMAMGKTTSLREQLTFAQNRLGEERNLKAKAEATATRLTEENTRLQVAIGAQSKELELLKRKQTDEAQLREEKFAAQLKAAQQGMMSVAQTIMEQNRLKLNQANNEHIESATRPLKEAIAGMRKAMEDNAKENARQGSLFQEQIRLMMESSRRIGDKAESLANVLSRETKVQGNMGEIILGDILASQGLQEGVHYEVQGRLHDSNGNALKNDDTGSEMQPDVILHYPQGQDVVIDSKVSITAYKNYVEAKTDEDKAKYLKEHIQSLRRHVAELARKDYSRYILRGRQCVDFVIMFVPFESSLQLALANDPTLWSDAFKRKVFISGEQNLTAIIHIIHVAWTQHQQAENQKKVFGLAEQLLDRLGDFIKRYNDLGKRIESANAAYQNANNKLLTGNQSVVKKVHELIGLGAKQNPNRSIPTPEEDEKLIE